MTQPEGAPAHVGLLTGRYERRAAFILAAALWITFACFHHGAPGWNVNTRLALTFALVEQGTVRIDDYADRADLATDDVAEFGGHLYSDKVIGVSLLGVPALALMRAAEAVAGAEFGTPVVRYGVTLGSVGLAGALAGVLLYLLIGLLEVRSCGTAPGGGEARISVRLELTRVLLVLGVFLGTLLLFYTTLFMSYAPAVASTLASLYAWERARAAGQIPGWKRHFLCGALLGLAMLFELTFGIVAAVLLLYYLADARRLAPSILAGGGALLALLPFFLYCYAIFGRFAIPYEFERNALFREQMAEGFMGIRQFQWTVLYLVTLHPYRGLFIHSPQLIAGVAGALLLIARAPLRLLAGAILAILAGYLAFNASYYMWWGGWSFGPRHLAPVIPFLGLAAWPVVRTRSGLALFAIAATWAIALHLIVNSVDPQIRDLNAFTPLAQLLRPAWDDQFVWLFPRHVWPLFRAGYAGLEAGELLGLRGPASLLPLAAIWAAAAGAFLAIALRPARRSASGDHSLGPAH